MSSVSRIICQIANQLDGFLLSAHASSVDMNVIKVGPDSTRLKCPQCKCIVNSRIQCESSMQTHVVSAMLLP